ncbi:MAG: metallophosphoesterase [Ignavibacteria bacterium]|nr:metallophosphoesterase [Ignavibacteria bacterium]
MNFKIAHISDLHINRKNKELTERYDKLVKSISKNKIDHLFITGDIVHNPFEGDYNTVIKKLKKYGYFSRDRLSVCIGNHEIYGGAEHGGKSYLFPTQCKNTNKRKRIQEFCNYFCDTFPENRKIFPYAKEIGDFVIFGINSVADWSLDGNPIGSNGEITNKELTQLKKLLNNKIFTEKIKIVLIHHHFYYTSLNNDEVFSNWLYSERDTMQLHNSKNIINLFREYGIKLVFHGHTHINENYKMNDITFFNTSGCLLPFTKKHKYEYATLTL